MSDTPETQEAVERWRQGKINIFDEMARLEIERNSLQDQRDFCMTEIERLRKERDEARNIARWLDDYEAMEALLCEMQGLRDELVEVKRERDEARDEVARLREDYLLELQEALRATRERDEAREALRVLFEDYKQLADSGDAGFWELEDKPAAQPALRILQQKEAAK